MLNIYSHFLAFTQKAHYLFIWFIVENLERLELAGRRVPQVSEILSYRIRLVKFIVSYN